MCVLASPTSVGLVKQKPTTVDPGILENAQNAVYQAQTPYVEFALKCHALVRLVDDVPYRIQIALATAGRTADEVINALESVHAPALQNLYEGAIQRKKQSEIREIDVRKRRLEDLQREKQALEDRLSAKILDISTLEAEIAEQQTAIDEEAGQYEEVAEMLTSELTEVLEAIRGLSPA